MQSKVVKPFPYSVDGFTVVDLVAGDERDFGEMTSGLASEGWIEAVEPSEEVASVDPDGGAEPIEMAVSADEPIEMAVADDKPVEMAVEKPRRGKRK